MIDRRNDAELVEVIGRYPALVVQGRRQSGKSTLGSEYHGESAFTNC
jgi:hypothetical protein